MAKTFKFELVSPERLLLSEEAVEVIVPGTEGEMTVMAEHAPTMTGVKPGIITVTGGGGARQRFVVFGGFADILPESLTLLAEEATSLDEVDREEIDRRLDEARKAVEEAGDDEARIKAEEIFGSLTTLRGTLLPA